MSTVMITCHMPDLKLPWKFLQVWGFYELEDLEDFVFDCGIDLGY